MSRPKLWSVSGSRGIEVRWWVSGFDRATGDGANVGPFRSLLRARLLCWWYNFTGERP